MKYLIKIESTPHGVLGVRHAGFDQQYCEAGEQVILKWQPDAKWGLQEAHYTDGDGNITPIDLTPVKVDGMDVVVFTMPDDNITVGGTFKRFVLEDWTGDAAESPIFNEHINATDQQRNTALANVSNQTANSTTGKMGYKVLDPTKTFAEQVTAENTIYEIRDVFDLDSGSITIPDGCTLKFNGGKLKNGTLGGDYDVIADDYSCMDVVTSGYNIVGHNVVYSNEIGLIPNDSSSATRNNTILQKVVNNCKELILTDAYYKEGQINVSGNLTIKNGKLMFSGLSYMSGFLPASGASISFYNVSFYSDNANYIVGRIKTEQVNYEINSIIFDGCFIDGCVVANFAFADQDYDVTPKGVRNFVVRNCNFINTDGGVTMRLNDAVFAEQFLIKGNVLTNPNAIFIYSATTNNFTYNTSNRKHQADCIIEDNVFNGKFKSSNTDYWGPVLIENKRVFFRRNIVKDYITGGSGFTYEVYANCDEYYFEDNYIENVCAMPISGVLDTSAQIFFNKASGSVRCAKRNVWKIDYNKCRQTLVDKYNVTFTDEQFEAINHIYIFLYQGQIELLDFTDNKIEIIGGKLFKSPSTKDVKTALINNNIFDIENLDDNALVGFNSQYNRKLVFKNNFIQLQSGNNFPVFYVIGSTATNSNCIVEICDNISNVYIPFGTGAMEILYSGNVYTQPINLRGNIYIFNNDNNIQIGNLRNDYNVSFQTSSNYPSGLSLNYKGCNTNIPFSIKNNVALRFEIPSYNYKQVFNIYFDSNNYTIEDENGIVLQTGAWEDTNYINLLVMPLVYIRYKIQTSNSRIYLIVEKQSGGSIPEIKIEFISKPAALNDTNKGKTRWDDTAGKLVVWNGTAWVNLDGTALS